MTTTALRSSRPAWLLAALLVCSACTPAITALVYGTSDDGPSGSDAALLDEELAPYREKGESAITGRVFLETPRGEVVAGNRTVHLTPATSYAKTLLRKEVIEGNRMLDRKAEDIWWTTRTSRDGRFVFSWLPAGDYLVLSEVAFSPDGGASAQTAVAYALVRVGEREHVDVVVKRKVD